MDTAPPDALTIARHCLQDCLHAAMLARDEGREFQGLLSGCGAELSAMLPLEGDVPAERVREFVGQHGLILPLVCADALLSRTRLQQLRETWPELHRSGDLLGIRIDLDHAGRLELHCLKTDGEEVPLSMQEDGPLYRRAATQ